MKKSKIAVFVGTRPEAIKMAPVVDALRAHPNLEPHLVSTGQHREMLSQVLATFELNADVNLTAMEPNQSLAALSATMLNAIDQWLSSARPDYALVQGDTTSVLMASLACFYNGIPFGHIEAGLRTYDLDHPFPEEANRALVSRLARHHFAPTKRAAENLKYERVDPNQIYVTGNTVIDALLKEAERQRQPVIAASIDAHFAEIIGDTWRERPIVLVTGHRRESHGDGIKSVCRAIHRLAHTHESHDFVYPVHLNPNVDAPVRRALGGIPNVHLLEPQPYRPFVALMNRAVAVVTDSGGLQEEAPALGCEVFVTRDTTERPEGVEGGLASLVGTDADTIFHAVSSFLYNRRADRRIPTATPYGDGNASERIARIVAGDLHSTHR